MEQSLAHITLGPLDHIAPWNIPQSVIYLSLRSDVTPRDAFARLQEGLRRTLIQLPWLNGRVHWQIDGTCGWRPGQLEIRYKPPPVGAALRQLRFHNLDGTVTFDHVKSQAFPLDMFTDEELLWQSPFNPDFESGVDVLAAQANFLPGGCVLALSVAAPASDGTAMLSVTRIWADHCCSAMESPSPSISPEHETDPGGSERTCLDTLCEREEPKEAPRRLIPEIYQLVGLDKPLKEITLPRQLADVNSQDNDNKMRPSLFYMPQSAYASLRAALVAQLGTTEVSGNNLICALIWRSIVRAWKACRGVRPRGDSLMQLGEAVSEVAIPFDCRPDFLDILPASFLGNANFENRLALPIADLVTENTSIVQLADRLRRQAAMFNSRTHMLQAYTLLSQVEDYRQLGQMNASRMKSPSVGILSPMTLPFNEACFGSQVFGHSGRPEAFRPLMGRSNSGFRTCFVMPRKSHGGIEFVMTLHDDEKEFLCNDDEFSEYAFFMA